VFIKAQNIKSANKKVQGHLAAMTDLRTIINNNATDSRDFYVRTQEAIIQYIEFSLNHR
jgi:hypothetical protein